MVKIKSIYAWAIIVDGKLGFQFTYETLKSAKEDMTFWDKKRKPRIVKIKISEVK